MPSLTITQKKEKKKKRKEKEPLILFGRLNCNHIKLMFEVLFLFVSAKLELCLGWCNIPASRSDSGYCVFHWKQRRKIILQQTEVKKKVLFLLLSSVKVFRYQRIMKKSQTVSMYCTESRYRYKCCIWPSLLFYNPKLQTFCVWKRSEMQWYVLFTRGLQNEQETIFHVTLS